MRRHKRGRWTPDARSPHVHHQVAALFSRRFDFSPAPNAGWALPPPENMFPDQMWQVSELQALKEQLNTVKSLLSNKEISAWHEHTCATNRAGLVVSTVRRHIKPEMGTQAWCKLYELLSLHSVLPAGCETGERGLRSLHLCEAPGAFVTALNHFCVLQGVNEWDWCASTLNPYHEGNALSRMISDDRFVLHTLDRWRFGEDDTGDLMTPQNMEKILKDVGGVNLVTADGSVDCQREPAEQERLVAPLHLCEVLCALRALQTSGSLVLKMFTFFEASSVCLLYLLRCCFREVSVVKPSCSKAGNSEVYVVCRDLTSAGAGLSPGHVQRWLRHLSTEDQAERPLFSREDVPEAFVKQVVECAQLFKAWQAAEIGRNLALWENDNSATWAEVDAVRQMAAAEFLSRCRLTAIDRQYRLTHPPNPLLYAPYQMENKSGSGTYEERTGPRSRRDQLAMVAAQLASTPNSSEQGDVVWQLSGSGTSDFRAATSRTEGLRPASLQACKFCSLHMLKLLRSVAVVLEPAMLEFGGSEPRTVAVPGGGIVKLQLPGHSVPWMCDAGTVADIREAAGLLQPGDALQIRALYLLHRLNISLIHVIAPLCEAVTLSAPSIDERPEPVVTLHAVADPVALVSLLSEVIAVLTPRTLSLLPVVELCKSPGADVLVSYNDQLLRVILSDLIERSRENEADGKEDASAEREALAKVDVKQDKSRECSPIESEAPEVPVSWDIARAAHVPTPRLSARRVI